MRDHIIILGGGLAGLTAALHLAQSGKTVTVVEKHTYPRHKVCGEYVSTEVVPYLKSLGIDLSQHGAVNITQAHFSTQTGASVRCQLPLGGLGISRFALDAFLYEKACSAGATFVFETADSVSFANDFFSITLGNGQILKAGFVIGAFGKRSNLDKKLGRKFISKPSPWLGVKAHYKGEFPTDTVGLHNFEGGYCGVSTVENGDLNICYLVSFEAFKKFGNIDEFENSVLKSNPELNAILSRSKRTFPQPLTISQINFDQKPVVENHMLMIGDAAGLIHPLCGNGMAMAIHSAQIASEVMLLSNPKNNRTYLEQAYQSRWNREFRVRMKAGRMLSRALLNPSLSTWLLGAVKRFPSLLPKIISLTHGKPMKAVA